MKHPDTGREIGLVSSFYRAEDGQFRYRNMHNHEIKKALGMRYQDKLPKERQGPFEVSGVLINLMAVAERDWRREKYGSRKVGRRAHRLMAICPCCNNEFSAGRLFQHLGTCEKNVETINAD